jgi:hypothetical protein
LIDHYATCSKCRKGKAKQTEWFEWIADSGASWHFTNDLNDFSDYAEIEPLRVNTAAKSNPLSIIGKGTVFVDHMVADANGDEKLATTRLYPVFYIPGLSNRLFSLGVLLQQGLKLSGDLESMSFYDKKTKENLLQCRPHEPGQTIYWLKTRIS